MSKVLVFVFASFLFVSCSNASIQAVGPDVVLNPERPVSRDRPGRLLAISWNVHVGHGDIPRLVETLSAAEEAKGFGSPAFVLMLQEVFRRGENIPPSEGTAPPRRISPPEAAADIHQVARQLGWWLYYAPSMRNGNEIGRDAEDRGNAILSSLPLDNLQAVELPYVVQRRVAIMATVQDVDRRPLMRVAVAHLDTRAPLTSGWIFGGPSGRKRQAEHMVMSLERSDDQGLPLVVGGDLNSLIGSGEAAVKTVAAFAERQQCGQGATHTSGFVLDHVFARFPARLARPACHRLNDTFGSDHYPLVLSIPL